MSRAGEALDAIEDATQQAMERTATRLSTLAVEHIEGPLHHADDLLMTSLDEGVVVFRAIAAVCKAQRWEHPDRDVGGEGKVGERDADREAEGEAERHGQDAYPKALGERHMARECASIRERDEAGLKTRGHDRNNRHAMSQRELHVAATITELHFIALPKRTKDFAISARIDEDRFALCEKVIGVFGRRTHRA